MGHIADYDDSLMKLDCVWQKMLRLAGSGRSIDPALWEMSVCPRRKNEGRHTVVPLHASIQEHCRAIGFDNLAPIIWHKIANAAYEVENGARRVFGKAVRAQRSYQKRHRVHTDGA